MQAVTHNPYRILGVLAGASAKEVTRQTNRLRKYLAAEQEPPADDYSFPALGKLTRTVESVADATAKLNLDADRMDAALFWFWKGNEITDEPALEALKSGDPVAAKEIWEKLTENKEVTAKNASAFHNLSVLKLWYCLGSPKPLIDALSLQLRLLESDCYLLLKQVVTDNTFSISRKELQLLYLNTISAFSNENQQENFATVLPKLLTNDILGINFDFAAKQDFLKSVSQKFTANINAQIETARKTRTTNKQQAAAAGETLYKNTKDDLAQLKEIFGEQDFSYSNVADKVANEILQCSIDFFNDSQEKELDNGYHEKAISLVKMAQRIAVGSLVKNKAKDNLQTLEEMKEKELQAAIVAMQMIKEAYEKACAQIDVQVQVQSMSLGWNQSINWDKVAEIKRNALDWNKVNELLTKVMSNTNIDRIKESTNSTKKDEFVRLAEWIKSHTTRKSVINNALNRYYGKTSQTIFGGTTSRSTPTQTKSSSDKNVNWKPIVRWAIIILGIIIGASADGHWIIGGLIGFFVSLIFKEA